MATFNPVCYKSPYEGVGDSAKTQLSTFHLLESVDRYLALSCPNLSHADDFGRELRTFQQVVIVLKEFCPFIETIAPGVCALKLRGPSRYFGGEDNLSELIHNRIATLVNAKITDKRLAIDVASISPVRIGIANGLWASLVAINNPRSTVLRVASIELGNYSGITSVVPTDTTSDFLAELPVSLLPNTNIIGTLHKLGINTIGSFANLTTEDVFSRFGKQVLLLHEMAKGLRSEVPGIRHYQKRNTLPPNIQPAKQQDFWGGSDASKERALGSLHKLESILGPEQIFIARLQGGWAPDDQYRFIPWNLQQTLRGSRGKLSSRPVLADKEKPWPGHFTHPFPSLVLVKPVLVHLRSNTQQAITVTRRSMLSDKPADISINGSQWHKVVNYAGPWTHESQWWSKHPKRQAYIQLTASNGCNCLLVFEHKTWFLNSVYD